MMDAQIPSKHMPIFEPNLKENQVYYITNFEVAEARAKYRPTDNPIMAKFTKYTQIKEISPVPDSFPQVVPFETLRARVDEIDVLSGNHPQLCNYYGTPLLYFKSSTSDCSPVLSHNCSYQISCRYYWDGHCNFTHRKGSNQRNTKGSSETLPVSLWGPHANQFDAEGVQAEADKHPVIMLFVGVTSKIQQLTLYGSTICRWYSNPIIPEVVALQQSLAAKPHEITWFGQPSTKKHACNATVPEIADLNPHDIMSNTYIVNIAIKEIIPGDAWWYIAYRLAIHGVDPSDLKKDHPITANFTFFGPVAEELIGIPPLTLVASVQGRRDLVPTEIARLYGRQLIVRVSASRRSLQMSRILYQVESMTFLPSEVPNALPIYMFPSLTPVASLLYRPPQQQLQI
uniref:DUF1618 domain-containing protein n=1 Tax=Oryza meridionalis TaxID=40149 RepID=A0A0E0D5H2_9ORYZ